MPPDCPPWTLTIPSDLRLIALARHFVESFCHYAGFDRQSTESVVLATHEAINNVIRHAHNGQVSARLEIQCQTVPEGLEIQLVDEGEPFDVNSVPHLNPSELRIGGRGVFLMRTLMDELSCEPRGERGNTLRMVKRCLRSAPVHADY
ncbi:MAG: ATP-binding protein [Gemmataceae bacterium]